MPSRRNIACRRSLYSRGLNMRELVRRALLLLAILTLAGASAFAGESKVSERDQLEFQQKNISAQMQELTERMYRLGELTRDVEPDDSARLILAVRKARESL